MGAADLGAADGGDLERPEARLLLLDLLAGRLGRGLLVLGMLLLAVLVAIWLARQIAWPIVTLSGAASRIGQLEISDTAALPVSVR